MTISEFLSDHLHQIVLRTVFAGVAAVFLLAAGTQAGIVILLGIVWFLVFLTGWVIQFVRSRARLLELQSIMDGLDQKYLFAECVPGGRNAYERKIMELSARAGRAMISAVSDAEAAQQEYREYVESFVHEMKAPITAAGLICRKADPEIRRKLTGELAQIEAHVERALFYARTQSPEKDFIVRQENLAQIVAGALGQYQALLLLNGIRVETSCLEQTVYTDGKWAAFIVGQLLQNAVRYRRNGNAEPVVMLSAGRVGKRIRLTVSDNGIGIPAHELPRVFDRGFTGSNGRTRGGSTGMGLYLCRKLAHSLELELQILSKEGEGTAVTLTFPAR